MKLKKALRRLPPKSYTGCFVVQVVTALTLLLGELHAPTNITSPESTSFPTEPRTTRNPCRAVRAHAGAGAARLRIRSDYLQCRRHQRRWLRPNDCHRRRLQRSEHLQRPRRLRQAMEH